MTTADTPSHDALKATIHETVERLGVKFMRLQFTDILGVIKNVEVPDQAVR